MADCWVWMKDSMRRRMGEEGVMPDSRLERVSRSAMVGASSFCTGAVALKGRLQRVRLLG